MIIYPIWEGMPRFPPATVDSPASTNIRAVSSVTVLLPLEPVTATSSACG